MKLRRHVLLTVVMSAACFGAAGLALGAEPAGARVAPATGAVKATTIALTMTKPAEAGQDRSLAENLLSLVELAVQQDKSLAVVERRQIELAIQELVLSQSRPGDAHLQLGKLITADYLVMLDLLPPDKDSQQPWGRLRVVDPKTGAIRGVTVAAVDEATLEETAEQFARYVSAVIRAPQKPTITVAVAPFESKGRFDRLRPLELGVRDLVTARLLELSGAAADPSNAAKAASRQPLRFQVLQRSSMEQLLRELDLIQSGLSDKSRLPDKLPPRAAAYLVRGEIDERQEGEKYTVVVHGEMIEAATERSKVKFDFECPPQDLEKRLAAEVDRLALGLLADKKLGLPAEVPTRSEVQTVKQMVLKDLGRFGRLLIVSNQFQNFGLQPRYTADPATKVSPGTPLGRYLLEKSIDRLESILFITPDDPQAAYALGFCCSIHQSGIYRPERADELLLRVYSIEPTAVLAGMALELRAGIAYDDRQGKLEAGSEAVTIERLRFAFEHTPAVCRDRLWAQSLRLIRQLLRGSDQNQALADLLVEAAAIAEKMNDQELRRTLMPSFVHELAMQVISQTQRQPALTAKATEVFERWAASDKKSLAEFGNDGLARTHALHGDHLAAGEACEAAAARMTDLQTREERVKRYFELVDAAVFYRMAKQPQRALDLLLSFQTELTADEMGPGPETAWGRSALLGLHGFEIGRCYELLGEPEKAHAIYLRAAQMCPVVVVMGDSLQRLNALGGVPLRADRDVNVKYFPRPGEDSTAGYYERVTHLASDGRKIYVGGKQGLFAFDVARESWEPQPLRPGWVTCLECRDGQLWAGTDADGLWRRDPAAGYWQRAAELSQLPDKRIASLTVAGGDVYCGVGTNLSGGLVRINAVGQVHVFNEPGAPFIRAPTQIISTDTKLLARTPASIYEWSFKDKSWSPAALFRHGRAPPLFAGKDTVWASSYGQELHYWSGSSDENARFRPAWDIPANNVGYVRSSVSGGGYQVEFVAEHGDDVWFGGNPWVMFLSSGLYRFNMRTGAFTRFGPAEGFKAVTSQRVFSGVWVGDQLWLATSEGLCCVTPRKQ